MKKIILIFIVTAILPCAIYCQDSFSQKWTEIDIQDSTFKNLIESFMGKTPEQFIKDMYKKGYIYLSFSCQGDKKYLTHFVEISYSSGVLIFLHIGEIKVLKFDEYDIPIREFDDVKNLPIKGIEVHKDYYNEDGKRQNKSYFLKTKEGDEK